VEERAMRHSPLLAQSVAALHVAEAKRTQADHAGNLPTFTLRNLTGVLPRRRLLETENGVAFSPDTASGFSDLRPFNDLEISLVQPLWTFGRLGGVLRAADAGVTASEAAVLAKEAEVRMQVRSLYWGLKLGAEVLQVVEDARKESLRAEEMVTTKLEEGSEEVTQTDLFKVQVFRYQVEKRYREAQRKSALAQRALASAIGLDENTPLMPTDEPLDLMTFILDSLANYQAIAMASRPELRQLDAGIRARSALSGVSSADYYPTIFLGGQIRLNRAMDRADPRNPFLFNQTNFTRMGAVLGLTMNLNLQQTRDKARIARREEELLSAQVIPARAGVRLEVEKAWREAEEAVSNVAGSTEALKATDNWLRSEAQVFDLGLGEVKDFIDAFQAHSTMRAEHAENIAAFNTAIAALGRAIGRDLYRQ
jgi:outer membrane protein TolC